ncbi:MAG: hypothetical protein IT163_12140 [Bryobacterales bacterium]|nr:hypothetical protein [Bryobacterales bacterium]
MAGIEMSVIRPRNRLVNFRLSEDEFEKLRDSCALFGARSISDFARSSVLSRLEQNPAQETGPSHRIQSLDTKVNELETRVGQLLHLLEATGTSPFALGREETAPSSAVAPRDAMSGR